MSNNSNSSLTLHDALALGQYEDAVGDSGTSAAPHDAEAHRLPLLLRLLSASRPLASLPDLRQPPSQDDSDDVVKETETEKTTTLVGKETVHGEQPTPDAQDTKMQEEEEKGDATTPGKESKQQHEEKEPKGDNADDTPSKEDDTATTADPWLDQVVQRLEDRAALYSAAEGLEVLAGHLAPHVCRKWSKLTPCADDTTALEQAIRGDATTRRRKLSDTSWAGLSSEEGNVLDEYNRLDDEEMESPPKDDNDNDDEAAKRKRRRSSHLLSPSTGGRPSVDPLPPLMRRQSTTMAEREFAAEDSQQALATKSWTELALLVVQSLQQQQQQPSGGTVLTVDEASILAQATTSATSLSADLSATLASLLHHTPVLRYDHVSTALCRVGLPQAVDVCARLGANAPAAVPALLRGSLVVAHAASTAGQPLHSTGAGAEEHAAHHQPAENHNSTSGSDRSSQAASSTAWACVKALASLSPYERARTCTLLRLHSKRNVQLELELAVDRGDALGLALLVDEHLHYDSFPPDNDDDSGFPMRGDAQLQAAACACLAHDLVKQSNAGQQWILPSLLRVLTLGKAGPLISFDWIPELLDKGTVDASAFTYLIAIAWIGYCQCKASALAQATENVESCAKFVKQLLERGPAGVSAFMICSWKGGNRLGDVVLKILQPQLENPTVATSLASVNNLDSSDTLLQGLSVEELLEKGVTRAAIFDDPSWLADCLSSHSTCFNEVQVRQTIGGVLNSGNAPDLLTRPGTLSLLVAVSSFLSHPEKKERGIPVVLPLQLESMGLKAKSELSHVSLASEDLSEPVAALLLNLASALCFIREQPDSPFCADLRSLPLREIYLALERMPNHVIDLSLRRHLKDGLRGSCKEVVLHSQMPLVLQRAIQLHPSPFPIARLKQELTQAIREAIKDPARDPNGEKLESLFCRAFGIMSLDTLCCTLASAFLSTGFPLSVFPYAKLCMDPLSLLKCPLNCWDRSGMRRVLLIILFHLFGVNDALLRCSTEEHEESAVEFRISRNVLFVRCMLSLMDECTTMRCCPATTSFIRASVSQCPGTGAAILRQGIGNAEIDWLVVNVPEMMDSGNAYHSLLALQTIPTTNERLVTASAVLRISVMHGHRDETIAQELALAAVSVLIANFFVVIGPVGVPVSTFVGEDKGTDATQVCRRAAMRMIKSIGLVRGQRQGLRSESIMALQKLARLCKGEEIVGGLPASVANRQKGFLREMLDGINKALFALGSSL